MMSLPARKVLLPLFPLALVMGLSACEGADHEANRFGNLAAKLAAIPLNSKEAAEAKPVGGQSAEEAGLRPLRVELMTPHQLWDARDGLKSTGAVVEAVDQVTRLSGTEQTSEEDIVSQPKVVTIEAERAQASQAMTTIQLGAYATEAAARTAWGRLGPSTQGLTPMFEPATVSGRSLVRLKVKAGRAQAQALCAVAAASDAWCLRAAAEASSTGST